MDLVTKAIEIATEVHRGQYRKGTDVPYITHPIEVMEIVRAQGGSEAEQAGAVCHDTAEDGGGDAVVARLRRELSDEVAEIVVGCSDSILPKGAEKAPWQERKESYIRHLRDHASGS